MHVLNGVHLCDFISIIAVATCSEGRDQQKSGGVATEDIPSKQCYSKHEDRSKEREGENSQKADGA